MKTKRLGPALAIAALAWALDRAEARAGLVSYTDIDAFHAAAPALVTQSFDAAHIGQSSKVLAQGPLNNLTNSTFILPGDIHAGLEIDATDNVRRNLIISNVQGDGLANKAISARSGLGLVLRFEPNVTAAGLGLVDAGIGLLLDPAPGVVTVYNPLGEVLGTYTELPMAVRGAGAFFGVTATGGDVIAAIRIEPMNVHDEDISDTAGVDLIEFGGLQAVPEPCTLALAACGAALLGAARRRQR